MGGLDPGSLCLKSPPLAKGQSWRPQDEKAGAETQAGEARAWIRAGLREQRERNRLKKYLGGKGLGLAEGGVVRAEGEMGNLTIPSPCQHRLQLRCKKLPTEVPTCIPPWKGLNTHLATRRPKAPHFTDGDTEARGTDPCLPRPPG